MEIDVRYDGQPDEIDSIRFANNISESIIPTTLQYRKEFNGVWLLDNVDEMFIKNKEQALNLIKALNKAIELGWLK